MNPIASIHSQTSIKTKPQSRAATIASITFFVVGILLVAIAANVPMSAQVSNALHTAGLVSCVLSILLILYAMHPLYVALGYFQKKQQEKDDQKIIQSIEMRSHQNPVNYQLPGV